MIFGGFSISPLAKQSVFDYTEQVFCYAKALQTRHAPLAAAGPGDHSAWAAPGPHVQKLHVPTPLPILMARLWAWSFMRSLEKREE